MEQQGPPLWIVAMPQFFGGQQVEVRQQLVGRFSKFEEYDASLAQEKEGMEEFRRAMPEQRKELA
eukprot:2932967-Lingulodinium_polyedra.AAC.1